MERYKSCFKRLSKNKEGAFVPFVTLGDPTQELSLKIIDTLIASGVDALELGIPFSDPLADGPTIQNANQRALHAGITFSYCFELLTTVRKKYSELPIGLLTYANLVFSNGIDFFYKKCCKAGVDSVLIADVPLEESLAFRQSAIHYSIAPIFICPLNSSDNLLRNISLYGKGYTYLLSRAGVTGSEKPANLPVKHLVKKLLQYDAAPILQGFGISKTSQVRGALSAGAAGVICGSAIVKIIENNLKSYSLMLSELSNFAKEMKAATY